MLEVKDATISVSGTVLVKNLSFIADDGKITCITGPEGSGKSILLRTLMGFMPVDDGFVSVDGELLTVRSAPVFRRFICYLPQSINLLRNQLYAPETSEAKPDDYEIWSETMPHAMEIPETKPLTTEEVFQLASATLTSATDKPILLADEPTLHLTADLASQMLQLIKQQAEQGKCVLIASRMPQVLSCANKVIDLNRFKL